LGGGFNSRQPWANNAVLVGRKDLGGRSTPGCGGLEVGRAGLACFIKNMQTRCLRIFYSLQFFANGKKLLPPFERLDVELFFAQQKKGILIDKRGEAARRGGGQYRQPLTLHRISLCL